MDHQQLHLSRIERLRRWLRQRAVIGGLLLPVAILAILYAYVLVMFRPLRAGQPVDGVIVSFLWYGRNGSSLGARVRLPEGEFMVHVPQLACRVGDRIHLVTTETPSGRSYGAAPMPCSAATHQ
jgi:hypothetical protein